jgi:hypothetical protein
MLEKTEIAENWKKIKELGGTDGYKKINFIDMEKGKIVRLSANYDLS